MLFCDIITDNFFLFFLYLLFVVVGVFGGFTESSGSPKCGTQTVFIVDGERRNESLVHSKGPNPGWVDNPGGGCKSGGWLKTCIEWSPS